MQNELDQRLEAYLPYSFCTYKCILSSVYQPEIRMDPPSKVLYDSIHTSLQ